MSKYYLGKSKKQFFIGIEFLSRIQKGSIFRVICLPFLKKKKNELFEKKGIFFSQVWLIAIFKSVYKYRK